MGDAGSVESEATVGATVNEVYEADASLKAGASTAAYRMLLRGAAPGAEVAARQLAATMLRQHVAAFPEVIGESCTAILALCSDAEFKVRLTAIGALAALCGAAAAIGKAERRLTMRRVLEKVEQLLAAANSLQARTLQASLSELVERHALTVVAVSLELLPPAKSPAAEVAADGADGADGASE